ncbi:hypothetical protein [Lysinibacillus xylanilyticus]|uniref:hypothetical protein n=1 Tax=Lysinibacillus xylanilyticus TaxID=582475 RepID=UPI003D014D56
MNIKGKVLASVLALSIATTGGYIMGMQEEENTADAAIFFNKSDLGYPMFSHLPEIQAYSNWDKVKQGNLFFYVTTFDQERTDHEMNLNSSWLPKDIKIYAFKDINLDWITGEQRSASYKNVWSSDAKNVNGGDLSNIKDGDPVIIVYGGFDNKLLEIIHITKEDYEKAMKGHNPQPPACK